MKRIEERFIEANVKLGTKCPICGKQEYKKLKYPWSGTLPARVNCELCRLTFVSQSKIEDPKEDRRRTPDYEDIFERR